MAGFPKFKLLFALKLNLNGGQFFKEILKFGYFEKWEKVRKIGVAEEIGCKSDIVLSKIGRGNELG